MTKPKPKPEPAATSALAEMFADFPTIDLLERRLLDRRGPGLRRDSPRRTNPARRSTHRHKAQMVCALDESAMPGR